MITVPTIQSRKALREGHNYQLGFYVLLADNNVKGYEGNSKLWNPELPPWLQDVASALYFTFIHPVDMDVPPAFQKLAASRGTNSTGAVPTNTTILFAIGGYSYSNSPNVWPWLANQYTAEAMARKVAKWPELYGCDGIDIDIEDVAGNQPGAGRNLVHFIKKLKEVNPKLIINQPVYGHPQDDAENYVVNHSWDTEGNSQGIADGITIMIYSGANSLLFVNNYHGRHWFYGPIHANVPQSNIQVGCKGRENASDILKLATEVVNRGLAGISVWYTSVTNGFHYEESFDANRCESCIKAFRHAKSILKSKN